MAEPRQVSYSIEREILHDTSCFSEGFFIRDGALFEKQLVSWRISRSML
jgi:hypothetical protein